jgi:hypothetical protein
MHPQFSGQQGGTIITHDGRTGQKQTNNQHAKWIAYHNTIDGETEGLAVFVYPDGHRHRWLTREYGTFGPKRREALNGGGFTLEKGESLSERVGILIHQGDAKSGNVAERYQQYIKGQLR